MGRAQKRPSFSKVRPDGIAAAGAASGDAKPAESAPKAPAQPSNAGLDAKVAELLKGLENLDLERPVRPPRRRDKQGSSGSNRSSGSDRSSTTSTGSANAAAAAAPSNKSRTSSDEVFSPSPKTLSPKTPPPADVSGAEVRLRKPAGGGPIFFKPGKTGGDEPGKKDSAKTSRTSPLKAVHTADKHDRKSATPCEPLTDAEVKVTKRSSRARVEMKFNLLKPIAPLLSSRKVRIRTTTASPTPDVKKVAVVTPQVSEPEKRLEDTSDKQQVYRRQVTVDTVTAEKQSAAVVKGFDKPASDDAEPEPTITVVLRKPRKGSEDEEDEGICSIEDIDPEELTRTDKAVLLRKKFSQLKVKSNALKAKDAEIQERFLMLQSKRNRISSVTKRSSRSVRSSLVGN